MVRKDTGVIALELSAENAELRKQIDWLAEQCFGFCQRIECADCKYCYQHCPIPKHDINSVGAWIKAAKNSLTK